MPDHATLADDELKARLLAAGIDGPTAGFLVRERDNPFIAHKIDEALRGGE